MAIQSASATLTAELAITAITGLEIYRDGILDSTGVIKAQGSNRWANLTTWSSFNNYQSVFEQIRWTSPMIDIGSVKYFNLDIVAEFTGTIDYIIHVSETGLFAGEEQEYLVSEGDYDVESFYGRYCFVTARVTGTELSRLTITSNTETVSIEYVNIDTSTLGGDINNRQLVVNENISKIVDVFIQPKAAASYAVNLYVSDTATSEVVIPVVKNKSSSLFFALYGIDNDARDSQVDILIKALPKQSMIGGNLRTIT